MRNHLSTTILALSVAFFGAAPTLLADPTHNPPMVCAAKASCSSCPKPDGCACGCILVTLDLGSTTVWTGQTPVYLRIHSSDESASLSTPAQLKVVMGWSFKAIGGGTTAGGAPQIVRFVQPEGAELVVHFRDGDSVGVPEPNNLGKSLARVQMVDAEGWATTSAPAFYDLYPGDGSVWRFLATGNTNERGALVSFTDPRGRVLTMDDFGVDIVRDALGNIRQVKTLTRLADVRTLSPTHYAVTVYPLAEEPEQVADTGLYALPEHAPTRVLDVAQGESVKELLVGFQKGTGDMRQYRYVAVNGDWTLHQPSGLVESQELYFTEDESGAQRLHTIRDETGKLWSRDEYNYVSAYWGYLITNRIEGIPGDATRTTSWSYYTDGPHKDLLRETVEPTGNRIVYEYDDKNRVVRESMPLVEEETLYSYEPVDPSDPPLLCDTRPRCVVKKMQGIEIQRTYYVYGTNGVDVVERVGEQGAAYGGTNVLRTVTTYYPVTGSVTDGLVQSVRHEDGTIDNYAYDLTDGVWTETVTHVHEQAPAIVPMRTTRSVRVYNALGQLVDSRTDLCTIGVEDLIPQADWTPIERLQYAYDIDGNEIRREDLAGRLWTAEWAGNCCGKVSETDWQGITKTYTYDEEGHLTNEAQVQHPSCEIVYGYDRFGRNVFVCLTNRVTNEGEAPMRIRYDSLGRIISKDIGYGAEYYSYSNDDQIVEVVQANGATTRRKYQFKRLTEISGTASPSKMIVYSVSANGAGVETWYDGISDESKSWHRFYRDMLGNIVREEKSFAATNSVVTDYVFDAYGHQKASVVRLDSEGVKTALFRELRTNSWDSFEMTMCVDMNMNGTMDLEASDRIQQIQKSFIVYNGGIWLEQINNIFPFSDSSKTRTTQRIQKRLTKTIGGQNGQDVELFVTSNLLGNISRQTVSVNREEGIVSYCTDDSSSGRHKEVFKTGSLILSTAPDDAWTTFEYDGLGRVIVSTDNFGSAERFKYDAMGNVIERINASTNSTHYFFNAFGQLETVRDSTDFEFHKRYDCRGNIVFESGNGPSIWYQYDNNNRCVAFAVSRNGTSVDEPDWEHNDTRFDITRITVNPFHGHIESISRPDGSGPSYEYDPMGRITKRIWARGIETTYHYNVAGNLLMITYSDTTPDVNFLLDRTGQITTVSNGNCSIVFSYDQTTGMVTNEMQNGRSLGFEYDLHGRMTDLLIDGGMQVKYQFDELSRWTNAWFQGNEITRTFGSASRLTHLNYGPITADFTYDNYREKCVNVDYFSIQGLAKSFSNEYDLAGRVSKQTMAENGYPVQTSSYVYDSMGQLSMVNFKNGTTESIIRYGFDTAGNRIFSEVNGRRIEQTFNALGQPNQIAGRDAADCFDSDGNQILVETLTGIWNVYYDAENRAVLWRNTEKDISIAMDYDYLGRRVSKSVCSSTHTNLTQYYYHGFRQLQSCGDTGDITTFWGTDPNENSIPLISNQNGSFRYFVHDLQKNIRAVCSITGDVIKAFDYSPYGLPLNPAFLTDGFSFSSEYFDADTGCLYYNFRFYNLLKARWCSRDPIHEESFLLLMSEIIPEDASDLTVVANGDYSFLYNNPIGHVDLLGLYDEAGVLCNGCRICLEPDTSMPGQGFHIHWRCGPRRRDPGSCRGKFGNWGAVRWPSEEHHDGHRGGIPPKIRDCLKRTPLSKKLETIKVPAKENCCVEKSYENYQLTSQPASNTLSFGTIAIGLCVGVGATAAAFLVVPASGAIAAIAVFGVALSL